MAIVSINRPKKGFKDFRYSKHGYCIAKCEFCGVEYYPLRVSSKYCSETCTKKAYEKKKEDEPFKPVQKKEVKKETEFFTMRAGKSTIAKAFTKYKLKSFVLRFLSDMIVGEKLHVMVYKETPNKPRFDILRKHKIERISTNVYQIKPNGN